MTSTCCIAASHAYDSEGSTVSAVKDSHSAYGYYRMKELLMNLLYKELIGSSLEHCHIRDYQDKSKRPGLLSTDLNFLKL